MNTLRWLRVVGDTIFALGIFGLGWFVAGLKTGWSVLRQEDAVWQQPIAERVGAAGQS
jgi:nitric oxide reductase subunit B